MTTTPTAQEAGERLRWHFCPQWAAWWLVFDEPAEALRGYGPFCNAFEISCAVEVHGVPFPPHPMASGG